MMQIHKRFLILSANRKAYKESSTDDNNKLEYSFSPMISKNSMVIAKKKLMSQNGDVPHYDHLIELGK